MWLLSRKVRPEVVERAKTLEVEVELPSLMEPPRWRDRKAAAESGVLTAHNRWSITTDVDKLRHLKSIFRRLEKLEGTFERKGVDPDVLVNLIRETDRLAGVVDSARQKAEKDVSEVLGEPPTKESFNDQSLRLMMTANREAELLLATVLKSQKASGMKVKPFIESLGLTGREVDVKSLFK